ncbi:cytochrome c-type biogenesis protein CcmH [Marinospirillum celere]|uniref:Cytochrome c-type biogenesis protein CcmH n=1 Tax=Marinospirillum celere TaxID=1122252 RepID=A0A1I1H6P2_9GAMM|nr:c-type cytochrome biogenesis protein CcmI [Marinospirillum celere]SFC16820.1 cytochrome c-type biogenesis protein CcmH [Marinospirillum celere]
MTGLWIGMVLLAVLTALFLIWPALRREKLTEQLLAQQNARQLANIDIYKQKLAQLEQDLEEGLIEQEDYPLYKREIEDLLLDDADGQTSKPWQLPGKKMVIAGIVLVMGAGLSSGWFVYTQVGYAPALQTYFSQQELIREGQQDFGSLLRRLEETVKANPDDIEGWSLLGRIYMDMGRLEDAADAMSELLRIRGPNARLLAQKAQALYFADGNVISSRVQDLIDQARELDANEPAVMSLLGMAAYQQQEWDDARRYWERALRRVDSADARQSLREGINETRERLGMEPLDEEGPGFTVSVSLSNAASLLVDPRATVFIFAHPQGQSGGAPVAVTRVRVSDLPATIFLSDQHAMTSDNNLSSAEEVVIQARVSHSGQPQAQEGDWQGQTEVLEVRGQQRVEVEINQQLQ